MSYVVYMLRCADGSLYTGSTNNLTQRIKKHDQGKGAKYTRGRGPFQIEYVQECDTKSAALRQESAIKKLSSTQKHALIIEARDTDEHHPEKLSSD